MTSFRCLITGSRDWSDFETIFAALDAEYERYHRLYSPFIVVHGAARGADAIAQAWYENRKERGWDVRVERFPAKWTTLGKRAGRVRNRQMVSHSANVCLAFPLPESIGTVDCMEVAGANGIPVVTFAPRVAPHSSAELVET